MKNRGIDDLKARVPSVHNWRTTDEEEIARRRLRAQTEELRVRNLDARHPVFSTFAVKSASGSSYTVEIRSISQRQFSCNCVDFRINGLGTCKHVEAVLLYLEARHRAGFRKAQNNGFERIEVVPDHAAGTLRIQGPVARLGPSVKRLTDRDGRITGIDPEQAIELLRATGARDLRISQEVAPWLEARARMTERQLALREYEQKVLSGEWPPYETRVPLYPYQREGMLHLAFRERALLADEMGLGKTIQAIAACALLHRLGRAARVLVVTPASLKTEWEEQIQRFTALPYQVVFGDRRYRLERYSAAPFFTIVNYEQMIRDALDVNERLQPDVVILDEAQRIKNWDTKTAQAVKRLRSRYAFVLTGTPVENRLDEIHSIMSFLDPSILGPLFRFNRDFYELDERGRPVGYRNLEQLHARIRPVMLRRRKEDVETELPGRTDRTFFVAMSDEQQNRYQDHEMEVARIAAIAKRRPLTRQEQEKLMRELQMMRMCCDTNYILDPEQRACPKLGELAKILQECLANPDVKVLVFSEWARMLELVREQCEREGIAYALHTGSVPQRRRRAEIQLFKTDPNCRIFLSTDSGSTGLNLQNASVVINCDLPWNPARLEQRIARAWRKHQTRAVTVIHLVSELTIEHRMLSTLSAKQALADGILDRRGDLSAITYRGGRQAFLSRLEQLMGPAAKRPAQAPRAKPLPVDRALAFSEVARAQLGSALVRCEERYPLEGAHSVVVVVVSADAPLWQAKLQASYEELLASRDADPLAPVKLEVIDRTTDEAIRRLIEAGLVAPSTRAIRLLDGDKAPSREELPEPERQKANAHRQQAARKLKMAKLLRAGGLLEEEREALLNAALWAGRALAVEKRHVEPESLQDCFRPPASLLWGESCAGLRAFAADPALPAPPVARALRQIVGGEPDTGQSCENPSVPELIEP